MLITSYKKDSCYEWKTQRSGIEMVSMDGRWRELKKVKPDQA